MSVACAALHERMLAGEWVWHLVVWFVQGVASPERSAHRLGRVCWEPCASILSLR